jgi:hypothetical protein
MMGEPLPDFGKYPTPLPDSGKYLCNLGKAEAVEGARWICFNANGCY